MAKRLSSGMVDYISQEGSVTGALTNGKVLFYSGTQPTSANDTASGTLLCTFTKASGAYTAETKATGTITISGAAGSIDTVTIGGVSLMSAAVAFTSDLTATAAAVAAMINNTYTIPDYKATSSTGTVTIIAPKNSGAKLNGLTVAATATTLTTSINGGSSTTLGGAGATAGVTAVNGLGFTFPNASVGVAVKETAAWTGVAAATGTAGYFRFVGDAVDPATSSTTAIRFDGSIGTSGADLTVSSTAITSGATQTINTFTISTLQAQ